MIAIAEGPSYLLAVLLISLVGAAIFDIWKRQVPNIAVIAAGLSGLAAFLLTGNGAQIWQPLLAAIAIIVIGVPLFARQWVGGGDIKLLAAAACWFTVKGALQFLASTLLAGGALALSFLAIRLVAGGKASRSTQGGIPYAVAIAIGAAFQVWKYRY